MGWGPDHDHKVRVTIKRGMTVSQNLKGIIKELKKLPRVGETDNARDSKMPVTLQAGGGRRRDWLGGQGLMQDLPSCKALCNKATGHSNDKQLPHLNCPNSAKPPESFLARPSLNRKTSGHREGCCL